MTKKTLIELMLENDVQWPEEAEFAAQDKDTNEVWFYTNRPKRATGRSYWNGCNIVGASLPELCRNWHLTLVTREQYEAAQVRRNSAKRIINDKSEQEVKSIIDKIAHHQAESQRHEELMLEHNESEIELRNKLNDILAVVGMKVVDDEPMHTEPEWPEYCDENGIVTDWDKVPEGVEVECVYAKASWFDMGDVVEVKRDHFGDVGPEIKKNKLSAYSSVRDGTYKFRLIK